MRDRPGFCALHLVRMSFGICLISSDLANTYSGHPKLLDTRLDPIRTEGKPASHVHRIAGSSALMETVTYEDLRASECSESQNHHREPPPPPHIAMSLQ